MKLFPPFKAILPVYALIVFLTYGWSLAVTFWKIPSWLLYMSLGDLAIAFCYIFVVNFVESAIFLIGLLGLGLILPARFLRNRFSAGGVLLALLLPASAMLHMALYANADLRDAFILSLPVWWFGTVILAAIGLWLTVRFEFLENVLTGLAERMIVFLYLFLPLTLVALVVVIGRNLWLA